MRLQKLLMFIYSFFLQKDFIFNIKSEILSPNAKKSVQLKKGIHSNKNPEIIINETEKAIEDLKKKEIFYRIIEEGDIQKKEIIVQFAINDPLKY